MKGKRKWRVVAPTAVAAFVALLVLILEHAGYLPPGAVARLLEQLGLGLPPTLSGL